MGIVNFARAGDREPSTAGVFGVLDYALDYIFRPAKVDLFREFGIAFGMAFGMNFVDVIFFKDKKNN